jgi:hypothetical protein
MQTCFRLAAGVVFAVTAQAAGAQVTCVPNPGGGYTCTGNTGGNAPLMWPGTAGPGAVVPAPATLTPAPAQGGSTYGAVVPNAGGGFSYFSVDTPASAGRPAYGNPGVGLIGNGGSSVPQNLPPPQQQGYPAGAPGGPSYGVIRPLPGGGFATYDLPSGQIGGAVPLNSGGYFYYRP